MKSKEQMQLDVGDREPLFISLISLLLGEGVEGGVVTNMLII